jgi:hypothetical protein
VLPRLQDFGRTQRRLLSDGASDRKPDSLVALLNAFSDAAAKQISATSAPKNGRSAVALDGPGRKP